MKNFFDFDLAFILAAGVFGSMEWVDPFYKLLLAVIAIVGIVYKIIDYHKKWKREENNQPSR